MVSIVRSQVKSTINRIFFLFFFLFFFSCERIILFADNPTPKLTIFSFVFEIRRDFLERLKITDIYFLREQVCLVFDTRKERNPDEKEIIIF